MKENHTRQIQLSIGIITALIILLQSFRVQAQAVPDSLSLLAKNYFESSMFSGFVRVEHKGEILLNQSYGLADYQKLIPFSSESRFRIGSLSKQFTAFIILNLYEEGKLKLTDSLTKYFPQYISAKEVTIHQLLHHTGGIPNFTDFLDYDSLKGLTHVSDLMVLKRIEKMALDFKPGTSFNYSNSGYVLLAMIAEQVTGLSWTQLTRKYITRPASLHNTGIESNRIKDGIVSGYDEDLQSLRNVADRITPQIAKGAGNAFSSPADLSKWLSYLMDKNSLDEATKKLLFTTDKQNYAKGWEVLLSKKHNEQVIYHSGGVDGFRTGIIMVPAYDIKIIVLGNMESGIIPRKLPFQLLDIVLGKSVSIPPVRRIISLESSMLKKYQGEYLLGEKLLVNVKSNAGYLTIQFPDQPEVRLYSEGNDRFFTIAVDASLLFQGKQVDQIDSFIFQQGNMKLEAKKTN